MTGELDLYVEMLGGFVITNGETQITRKIKRTSKTWKLLQYLIIHRGSLVMHDELIDVFFKNEPIDNPGSALRTMVYRTRTALEDIGLSYSGDLILSKGGGYMWNSYIKCSVDIEEFEQLCRKANAVSDNGERLRLLLRAAALYKGDFLPNSSGDMWVIPLSRFYRSLYTGCVHDALELLSKTNRYNEVVELCLKALNMDPFDDVIIEYHLRALLALGKKAEALGEYNRMKTLFYDTLGVNLSEPLKTLEEEIYRPTADEGVTLDVLLTDWLDGAIYDGAYYCDTSLFRTLYQVEARSVPRTGRTAYIVRIITNDTPSARSNVMEQLHMLIPINLRMGDIFTRASDNQYLLMLHSLTLSNCRNLVDRILGSLDHDNKKYIDEASITTIRPLLSYA